MKIYTTGCLELIKFRQFQKGGVKMHRVDFFFYMACFILYLIAHKWTEHSQIRKLPTDFNAGNTYAINFVPDWALALR